VKRESAEAIVASSEIRRSGGRRASATKTIELKNRSKTESMFDVVFVFRETNDPSVEHRLALTDELKPKQSVNRKPEVDGSAVMVTQGYFEWRYETYPVTSTNSIANLGYFYETLKLTASPDGSYELFWYKQRRL
jgi:hypothetical protein